MREISEPLPFDEILTGYCGINETATMRAICPFPLLFLGNGEIPPSSLENVTIEEFAYARGRYRLLEAKLLETEEGADSAQKIREDGSWSHFLISAIVDARMGLARVVRGEPGAVLPDPYYAESLRPKE